ncbi:class I SAM-dependent methyltransferase [Mangrovitalea sediminis]|uniref:class I SAM-dependent methyltransferase n=1 Tax=Mangrovitalea sediminis TaxID=1982043 RepID=UPI000BE4D3CF|nr:class I SAM-dependent methyltransferase [Mangrovitalea sediminis]
MKNTEDSVGAALLGVACGEASLAPEAEGWAQRLQLPYLGPQAPREMAPGGLLVWLDHQGLALRVTGRGAPGPVIVDFSGGKAAFRRLHGGGRGQLVAKAVGLSRARRIPSVLDATAGLGQDAFVLATLGCSMLLLERSPVVHALLEDGLARASQDPELAPIIARMKLQAADAAGYLEAAEEVADVVYLDPMFPHRGQQSALVKKEMRVFRDLVGDDLDADRLLPAALQAARCRVVVKRPRKAPPLAGPAPSHALEGKSSRYDLYTLRALD